MSHRSTSSRWAGVWQSQSLNGGHQNGTRRSSVGSGEQGGQGMAWHGNLLVVVVCCQVLSKDSEALGVGQGVDVFGIEEEGRSIRDSG